MDTKKYKVVNGISFLTETPDAVCNILARYCGNRNQRVRIFLGDTKTGKDWFESYDTIGYIGRSCGTVKIPLLIHNTRSMGGSVILEHCIVKITVDKKTVYQHPNYHCPIEKRGNELYDTEKNVCIYRNPDGVDNMLQFFLGQRNAH
jgi:hypothetical protein